MTQEDEALLLACLILGIETAPNLRELAAFWTDNQKNLGLLSERGKALAILAKDARKPRLA